MFEYICHLFFKVRAEVSIKPIDFMPELFLTTAVQKRPGQSWVCPLSLRLAVFDCLRPNWLSNSVIVQCHQIDSVLKEAWQHRYKQWSDSQVSRPELYEEHRDNADIASDRSDPLHLEWISPSQLHPTCQQMWCVAIMTLKWHLEHGCKRATRYSVVAFRLSRFLVIF